MLFIISSMNLVKLRTNYYLPLIEHFFKLLNATFLIICYAYKSDHSLSWFLRFPNFFILLLVLLLLIWKDTLPTAI
jgi:hypothetical protein